MLEKLRNIYSTRSELWELRGYDTFADEWYPLPGRFSSEQAARRAARKELEQVEQLQPSRDSGGQKPGGIQDRIYIVRPDKTMYRYLPED